MMELEDSDIEPESRCFTSLYLQTARIHDERGERELSNAKGNRVNFAESSAISGTLPTKGSGIPSARRARGLNYGLFIKRTREVYVLGSPEHVTST